MLLTTWQLVVKRSLAHWKLLVSVVVGVVLASVITSGTIIYFDSLRELALRTALEGYPDSELDIILKGTRGPTTAQEYQRVASLVEREVGAHIAPLLEDQVLIGRSATMFLARPEQENNVRDSSDRSYFAFAPTLLDQITLLPGGRLPSPDPIPSDEYPLVLEALVPRADAERYGVGVGDRLSAVQTSTVGIPYISVVISGLFERRDPSNSLWRLDDEVLRSTVGSGFNTVPFFIPQETFLGVMGQSLPQMSSTYGWLLNVDASRITSANSTGTLNSIRLLNQRIGAELIGHRQLTSLDDALATFDQRLLFSKLQMFVVLILIAVVVLYYVVTISALLVEQNAGEIILLRGRGASSFQILIVFALEGATISVLAAIVAPLLASFVVAALGLTPLFSELTDSSLLTVSISGGAYAMSALGGVLSFFALMIPAFRASRMGVARHRQEAARPTQAPFYQRYYLDVLLLIVGIFMFTQLREQGSLAARGALGEVVENQLLLAAPAVILVASAMVLLRVFPIALTLLSRALSPHAPPGALMGLWQMARNPTHYGRLSLLLILMAGLGILAASFGGTLERSFRERVQYQVGSDIRIEGIALNTTGQTRAVADAYSRISGVESVSHAFRGRGVDLTNRLGRPYEMFAVDSDTFAALAWFRNDFSDRALPEVVAALDGVEAPPGLPLPPNTRGFIVFAKADRAHQSVILTARVRDANGRYFNFPLGTLDSSSWRQMEVTFFGGDGPPTSRLLPSSPLTLVSLMVHQTNPNARLSPGSLLIDDIRVRRGGGDVEIIETLSDSASWSALQSTPEAAADRIRTTAISPSGDGALLFLWGEGPPLTSRGIFFGEGGLEPLPVLANDVFLEENGHKLGDEITVSLGGARLPVRLADSVAFFPTLDTPNNSYLIADVDQVVAYANLGSLFGEVRPNEVWLSTSLNGQEREALLTTLSEDPPFNQGAVRDMADALEAARVDPLVETGWRALLFISFSAVLILSCIGFLIHAYVSFRSRQLQFALMRTIGFSMWQLIALVWLEQILVIGAGMALGIWMGGRIGAVIMPFLASNETGGQVLPPLVLQVEWGTLAMAYAAMGVVFALIIVGVTLFIKRISLSRVLRLGDI